MSFFFSFMAIFVNFWSISLLRLIWGKSQKACHTTVNISTIIKCIVHLPHVFLKWFKLKLLISQGCVIALTFLQIKITFEMTWKSKHDTHQWRRLNLILSVVLKLTQCFLLCWKFFYCPNFQDFSKKLIFFILNEQNFMLRETATSFHWANFQGVYVFLNEIWVTWIKIMKLTISKKCGVSGARFSTANSWNFISSWLC